LTVGVENGRDGVLIFFRLQVDHLAIAPDDDGTAHAVMLFEGEGNSLFDAGVKLLPKF
jgi:hypothetical protein